MKGENAGKWVEEPTSWQAPYPLHPRLRPPSRDEITGVILAGGRGQRMGGSDKGLLELAGRPLIEYVLDALTPQVSAILINANRNLEVYARYGHRVVADDLQDYQGPLAGLAVALATATTPWVLTVPCDGPHLHPQLAARLANALQRGQAELAVAHDGVRLQPTHALVPVALAGDLAASLAAGERALGHWYASHPMARADFSDCPHCFRNANTPAEQADLSRAIWPS